MVKSFFKKNNFFVLRFYFTLILKLGCKDTQAIMFAQWFPAKVVPKHLAADYQQFGVRLDPLKRTNHCSALVLENLHSYLQTHPSDPLFDYIPEFSSVVACDEMLCMLMPEVNAPFTTRRFLKGRNLNAERMLADSLANVTKQLAVYYSSQNHASDSFLAIIDFSLQNVGIIKDELDNAHVQFVDLESFRVIDGGINTLLAYEDIIDGYSILRKEDVCPTRNSPENVNRRYKSSMVIMFAVLTMKAKYLSMHAELEKLQFEALLERPPISSAERNMYLLQFEEYYGVNLHSFLIAISDSNNEHLDIPLLLSPTSVDKNKHTRHDRDRERSAMSTALKNFQSTPNALRTA